MLYVNKGQTLKNGGVQKTENLRSMGGPEGNILQDLLRSHGLLQVVAILNVGITHLFMKITAQFLDGAPSSQYIYEK